MAEHTWIKIGNNKILETKLFGGFDKDSKIPIHHYEFSTSKNIVKIIVFVTCLLNILTKKKKALNFFYRILDYCSLVWVFHK